MTDSLGENFTVATDKGDYQPGEAAVFTASNVDAGGTVEFSVAHVNAGADGIYGTEDDLYTYDLTGTGVAWSVTDGGDGDLDGAANGVVTTSWYVNWDALNQSFLLSANSGGQTATTSFTDAVPVPAVPASLPDGTLIQASPTPTTGSGVINSFLRIQASPVEQGINTDNNDVQFDTKSGAHTHHINLVDIPVVTIGTTQYRELRLDLNDSPNPITLNELQLWFASDPDLNNFDASGSGNLPDGTLIWDLDGGTGGDISIALVDWNSGSGKGDYVFYIPEIYFDDAEDAGNPYIYVYAGFGNPNNSDGGFEEFYTVVAPNPGVSIDKTAEIVGGDVDGVIDSIDDDVEYTIVVTNTGNVALTGVSVSDKVESYASVPLGTPDAPVAGVTIVVSGAGTPGDAILDVGEVWTYTFTYDVVQSDIDDSSDNDLDNTATVDTTQTAPLSDSAVVPIIEGGGGIGQFAMDVTKTADVASVDEDGDLINYTITVTNTGTDALHGVVVSDPLLEGAYGTLSSTHSDTGTGTHDDNVLDPGETWTFTGSYTVQQSDLNNNGIDVNGDADGDGDIDNTVSATADETGPETADAFVNIVYNPDYTILKSAVSITNPDDTDGGTKIDQAGDVVTYTIVIENTGNIDITGVVVTDKVEGYALITLDTNNSTVDTADDAILTGDDGNDGILGVDETWTYTLTYTVVQADINANGYGDAPGDGFLDNTAKVTSNEAPEKSDDASVEIVYNPDYTIEKTAVAITNPDDTDGGTKIDQAGDVVTYEIVVENTGNVDITGVVVTDKVESHTLITLDTDGSTLTTDDDAILTGDDGDDGVLGVGETWTYTLTYTVVQADINNNGYGIPAGDTPGDGFLDNTATVSSDQVDDKSDSESVEIVYNPDLDITKTIQSVTGGHADHVGDVITYQIVVDNVGNVDLTGVVVTDQVEGNALVIFDVNHSTVTTADDAVRTGDTGNDGILGVNETWTYTYLYTLTQADVFDNADNRLYNTATADSNQTDPESDTAWIDLGPGVRTQGFWSQKTWVKFWDGVAGNEPSQAGTDGFPGSDITRPPYANADATPANVGKVVDPVGGAYKLGILVGDWDLNGETNGSEQTIFYTQAEALAIMTAPPKTDGQDARFILDRQLITSWLNYQAGNPVVDPNEGGAGDALDAQDMINWGIAWIQKTTPNENAVAGGDGSLTAATKVASSSPFWNVGIDGPDAGPGVTGVSPVPFFDAAGDIPAGATIASYLDEYNNHGTILGVHIATV